MACGILSWRLRLILGKSGKGLEGHTSRQATSHTFLWNPGRAEGGTGFRPPQPGQRENLRSAPRPGHQELVEMKGTKYLSSPTRQTGSPPGSAPLHSGHPTNPPPGGLFPTFQAHPDGLGVGGRGWHPNKGEKQSQPQRGAGSPGDRPLMKCGGAREVPGSPITWCVFGQLLWDGSAVPGFVPSTCQCCWPGPRPPDKEKMIPFCCCCSSSPADMSPLIFR